jgi:uncharacterized membrane protein required for colicin V production
MPDIWKQFNWIDILVLILLVRITVIAAKVGLVAEFFKLLGTIAAICLALHYYTSLSTYLRNLSGIKNLSLGFLDLVVLLILALAGYASFAVLRILLSRLINMEPVPNLNKYGGLALGVMRSFLFISLMICIFLVSGAGYLKRSVGNSASGRYIFKVAPASYSFLWQGIFSKFFPGGSLNNSIFRAGENLKR